MKSDIRKSLDFYLALSYPITIHQDPDGGFVAEIEDLPGCITQVDAVDELLGATEDAKRSWITAAYEMGQDIPLPKESDEFKGKVLLRISRSLHRELANAAKVQGVSLNQYAANLLAAGVHGDLLKEQIIDFLDQSTRRVHKSRFSESIIFGNNELPIRHGDLIKLTGTQVYSG